MLIGKIKHTAFYILHDTNKDWLLQEIAEGKNFNFEQSLSGLKGQIFSNITLQHFINEEVLHDNFVIGVGNNNTLTYSSSGEKRKALLSHIISKNPGYIIIDSVFESLDTDTRESILQTLTRLSQSTLFVQVFNRKSELLPFIESIP